MARRSDPLERFRAATAAAKARLAEAEGRRPQSEIWRPNPGPQEMAYESEADVIGYGGKPGGGKSDFLIGRAVTKHLNSIVFRREGEQVEDLVDRCAALLLPHGAKFGERKFYNIPGGRQLRFAGIQHEKHVWKWQGRAHDFYGFDELTHFSERSFRIVTGWNRSTEKVPCTVAAAFNPPHDSQGQWVKSFWAPWLDKKHPNPAKPGELRWYARIDDRDVECDGSKPIQHRRETILPKSRTFIFASLDDNPYLRDTNYLATIQSLPEPLRSLLLFGDFDAMAADNAWQVIPTAWVVAAQERWAPTTEKPATGVGVDVSRGGRDKTVVARWHGDWLAPLVKEQGVSTDDGEKVASLVILHAQGVAPAIDLIGCGTSCFDFLNSWGRGPISFNAAAGSRRRDRSGQLKFRNLRAEAWWRMREALDPATGANLALPPDPELLADLTAPLYFVGPGGTIQVEPKDEITKRLGRSPDCGDAVVIGRWAQDAWQSPVEYGDRSWLDYGLGDEWA